MDGLEPGASGQVDGVRVCVVDLGVLDVRMVLSYDGPFMSSIPPSLDAIMIPLTEQEPYTV